MSKRIAEAFRGGDCVQPRISTEAARWLLYYLEQRVKMRGPRRWVDNKDFIVEIIGALQCELDELK